MDDVPASPTKALQVVVSRARSATAPAAIAHTAGGYRLDLGVEDVDVWALRPRGLRLAAEHRYEEALPLLERAAPDDDVMVALLRAEAAVRGLASALDRYERHRKDLADRLGVDPSPELRALHLELLARDRPVRSGLRHYASEPGGSRGRPACARRGAGAAPGRLDPRTGRAGQDPAGAADGRGRRTSRWSTSSSWSGSRTPADVVAEVGSVLGVRDSVTGRTVLTAGPAARRPDSDRPAARGRSHPAGGRQLRARGRRRRGPRGLPRRDGADAAGAHDDPGTARRSAAERVYPLGRLDAEDGARLFRDRADGRATRCRGTAGSASTASSRRLDGLPLAIELAAVKVRVDERRRHRSQARGPVRAAPGRRQDGAGPAPDPAGGHRLVVEPPRGRGPPRAAHVVGVPRRLHGRRRGRRCWDDAAEASLERLGGAVAALRRRDADRRPLPHARDRPGVRPRSGSSRPGRTPRARAAHRAWAVGFAARAGRPDLQPRSRYDAIDAAASPRRTTSRTPCAVRSPRRIRSPRSRSSPRSARYWSIRGDHPRVILLVAPLVGVLRGSEPAARSVWTRRAHRSAMALVNSSIASLPESKEILLASSPRWVRTRPVRALRAMVTVTLAVAPGQDPARARAARARTPTSRCGRSPTSG